MEGIGKPNWNTGDRGNYPAGEKKTFYKNVYFKAGDKGADEGPHIVFRVLPPIKSLADNGKGWHRKIGEHWGHVQPTKVPGKSRPLIFACCEVRDFNTKTIVMACPKHEQIAQKKQQYEELKKVYAEASPDEQEALVDDLDQLKSWIKNNRFSRQHNLNVMLEDGTFALLKMSTDTFSKALTPLINGLRSQENIDPIDVDGGVWFEGYRSGHGLQAVDIIKVVTEKFIHPEVGTVFRTKKAPLTDAQLTEALKICPDLATETVAYLSPQQIQLLVDGSNDPEENVRVLALGKKEAPKAAQFPPVTVVNAAKTDVKAAKSVPVPAGGALPKVAPKNTAPVTDDDDEAYIKSLMED
jgi:hypothetical protein